MMLQDLLAALCLVMVIEGILPFIAPSTWRKTMQQITLVNNQSLRIAGLISMLLGASLLFFVR